MLTGASNSCNQLQGTTWWPHQPDACGFPRLSSWCQQLWLSCWVLFALPFCFVALCRVLVFHGILFASAHMQWIMGLSCWLPLSVAMWRWRLSTLVSSIPLETPQSSASTTCWWRPTSKLTTAMPWSSLWPLQGGEAFRWMDYLLAFFCSQAKLRWVSFVRIYWIHPVTGWKIFSCHYVVNESWSLLPEARGSSLIWSPWLMIAKLNHPLGWEAVARSWVLMVDSIWNGCRKTDGFRHKMSCLKFVLWSVTVLKMVLDVCVFFFLQGWVEKRMQLYIDEASSLGLVKNIEALHQF